MKLIINDEKKEINCKMVMDLLNILDLEKDMVAVELNEEIVHRQDFNSTTLKDNDKLEIVTVVGGG